MPSILSRLPKQQRQELLADLNYLNTAEIKSFCSKHAIPYTIVMETRAGQTKKTRDEDRKGVMLQRVRHFLETGTILSQTRFPASVVSFDAMPATLTGDDRLFYGQYRKGNRTMLALLRRLTGGRFQEGAIARIVAREFWARGEAPTFQQYASEWMKAESEHARPNAEWAFLSDRANKTAPPDWKKFRAGKAKKVLKMLKQITTVK